MIELYSFPTPNGFKVAIALEELELPYRITPINIARDDQFLPEFLAISPNNRIPAIVDRKPADNGEPLSVFESGAILQYLAEKTGRLMPNDYRKKVLVNQWLMWQMGGLGPMLGQAHHFRMFSKEKVPYGIERYTNEASRLYHVLEKQLEGKDYIAGTYSIADIACFPWINLPRAEWQGQELAQYPNISQWLDRINQRPGVQRGLKAGEDIWGNPPLTPEEIQQRFPAL